MATVKERLYLSIWYHYLCIQTSCWFVGENVQPCSNLLIFIYKWVWKIWVWLLCLLAISFLLLGLFIPDFLSTQLVIHDTFLFVLNNLVLYHLNVWCGYIYCCLCYCVAICVASVEAWLGLWWDPAIGFIIATYYIIY